MRYLVQTLPANPLDIVGDIHGESGALDNLLHHLGYAPDGSHPQQRKLVFVGDLVDRGLDSVGVVKRVMHLVQHGNALCILGNHEINLLLDDVKDGSGWFFDERYAQDQRRYGNVVRTATADKAAIRQFLNGLPLILERDDIRIVHASWKTESVEAIRTQPCGQVADLYRSCEESTRSAARQSGLLARYQNEKAQWADQLEDETRVPPLLAAMMEYESIKQVGNPVELLTSGVKAPTATPFFAGNRWRFSDRVNWWQDYADRVPVVFGHYWRLLEPDKAKTSSEHERLFGHIYPAGWFGRRQNVFCVDYSVGARWRERKAKHPASATRFHLAALQWPERQLVLDDGRVLPTLNAGRCMNGLHRQSQTHGAQDG